MVSRESAAAAAGPEESMAVVKTQGQNALFALIQ